MDYKEKLRLAKEALDSGSYDKETIEYIFPELAESEDEKIRKTLINFFQRRKDDSDDDETWYELSYNDILAWLEKQGEQKPSVWSEEDEKNLLEINCLIGNYRTGDDEYKLESWLKSLKDRVQPQQKGDKGNEREIPFSEWSKEDEKVLENIIIFVSGYADRRVSKDWVIWLKSLRPQKYWKPSDEQMDALRYVTNFDYGGHKATLVSLYEQLKKLKG